MTLETAQIMATVLHKLTDVRGIPYKPTHENHPCVIWAGESRQNFLWLCVYGEAIAHEYKHRYGRVHASTAMIGLAINSVDRVPVGKNRLTPFAQAMPEPYKSADPVEAYRNYYLAEKVPTGLIEEDATENWSLLWRNRGVPYWIRARLPWVIIASSPEETFASSFYALLGGTLEKQE